MEQDLRVERAAAAPRREKPRRLDPLVWTAAGLTLFWIGALLAVIALVP